MSRPADLEALVEALRDPACYPHPVETPVRVIETHISIVLLAGGLAYKLKKPLDLGFLDFSTLERRREGCLSEVLLNRRLAPSIYLGVSAVRSREGRLRIEPLGAGDGASGGAPPDRAGDTGQACAGDGRDARSPAPESEGSAGGRESDNSPPVLEYAVRMRAFEQADLLDRRLAEGRLEPSMIDAVAQTLARFHARVSVAGVDSDFGTPEAVARPVRDNFATLARMADDPARRALLASLARHARREQRRLAGWFAERRAGGFVRECHGDLHLGNIAWVAGEPCVFDCLEFNAGLRWIDVAAEVAFLVMDLAGRGRADLAWRLLDGWLARSGDCGALPGLRYYLCYRATVRAKVVALRRVQPRVSPHEALRLAREEEDYLRLSVDLSRPCPMVMITHGVSGSGKSQGARWLLERLGAVRVRSDVERKRLAGRDALDHGDAVSAIGEGLYSASLTRRTYDVLEEWVRQSIAGGFPVIVDAAFLDRAQRDRFRDLAGGLGVPFRILAFSAPVAQLRARVRARAAGGEDASDAGIAVLEHQLATVRPLQPDELAQVVAIDASASGARGSLESAARVLGARPIAASAGGLALDGQRDDAASRGTCPGPAR